MLVGAQHNALDALLHAVLAGAVLPMRRLARRVRVAVRGTGGARGAAVGQPRGAWAPRKLLDAGCGHRCGKKRPPSALLSPAFYDNFRFIIAAELYLAVSL